MIFFILLSPPAGCCSLTLSECLLGASQGNSFFDCIMKTSDSTKHLFVRSFICKLIALIFSSFSLSLSWSVSYPLQRFQWKISCVCCFPPPFFFCWNSEDLRPLCFSILLVRFLFLFLSSLLSFTSSLCYFTSNTFACILLFPIAFTYFITCVYHFTQSTFLVCVYHPL